MSNERSVYLSFLLRHRPEAAKLTLDREGWVPLAELMANTDFMEDELRQIVAEDAKGRYSIKEEPVPSIRANQGHSTSTVRLTFTRATPPVVLYHGSSIASRDDIAREGLKPMKRHHVHLTENLDDAAIVGGRRKGSTDLYEVDCKAMLADQFQFFISDNGVWLTEAVPSKYLKLINP